VDGDLETYWKADATGNAWLLLDLGATGANEVSGIRLMITPRRVGSFELFVGDTEDEAKESETSVFEHEFATPAGNIEGHDFFFGAVAARFWLVRVHSSTGWHPAITEVTFLAQRLCE